MELADARPRSAAGRATRGAERGLRLERVDPADRLRNEGAFLVLVGVAVALSFALPALKSRHVWVNVPCVFHAATGLPCLLCGMTRSFVFTAHGNLAAAFRMHMLGPPTFFIACAACAYLAAVVTTGYRLRLHLPRACRRTFSWLTLAVFVVFWALKLVFLRAYW